MTSDERGPSGDEVGSQVFGAPRLPSWLVRRPRLVHALDGGAPLTVVRAPAGGGKTVLLAEWARESSQPSLRAVWVSVSASATSPASFWSEILTRLSDAGLVGPRDVFASGAAALQEVGDVRSFLVRGFAQLGPLTLVLDGADRLDGQAAADLVHVLGAVPRLRAVVASRSTSPFESPAVSLLIDVTVLDGEDLALSVAETAQMLDGDVDAAPGVHRVTDGSPLATRAIRIQRESEGIVDAGQALEPLVVAVVGRLGGRTADFVRATAVADVVPLALARTLSGTDEAAEMLVRIEQLGLGTWTGEPGGAETTFTYTSVVRLALRAELRRTDPERFAALRRQVALWCDANGRPVEALQAATDAGDVTLATTVVRHHWRAFLSEHAGTIRPTVAPLGLVRMRNHPVLIFFTALGYNADRRGRVRAVSLFGLAIAAARVAGPRVPPHERLVLRAIEMIALRLTGRGPAAAHAADDVVRRIEALTDDERATVHDLLSQIYAHTGIVLLYDGRADEAVDAFERGLGEATTDLATLPNLALLAGTHALGGSLRRAMPLVEEARGRAWPEGWIDGYSGSLYQVAEAVLALEVLDVERARTHLDRLERHLETIEHWPLIAQVQASVDLLSVGADAALERLEDTCRFHARRHSSHNVTTAGLTATRALLLVAAGRPDAAVAAVPEKTAEPVLAVALARAQLVAGQPEKALASLARSTGPRRAPVRRQTEHALIEAAALVVTDHEAEAAAALGRAVGLLTVHGLRLPLVLLPALDRARLRDLAARHDMTAAADLLAAPLPDVVPTVEPVPELTPRETVILQEIARTGSITEIAASLFVSTHTVKSQLRTLYRKLGVSGRQAALAVARRRGLLDDVSDA